MVIYLRKGVAREWARRELERMFGPKYRAFTVTNNEIRTEVMHIFDQTFLITYALLAVAIVVAVTSLNLWARQFAGYHDGTLSGIYLALVVTAATVTTVSAARGTRASLAHP